MLKIDSILMETHNNSQETTEMQKSRGVGMHVTYCALHASNRQFAGESTNIGANED